MQKNDKTHVFLLKHSSKKGIYIKRVAVSKRGINFSAVGSLLLITATAVTFGLTRLIATTNIAETAQNLSFFNRLSAQPPVQNEIIIEDQQQPTEDEIALNSGGPANDTELDGEDKELDTELKAIAAKTDGTFIPTEWAHLGKINNEFGFRRNPFGGRAYEFHPGMDIDGEKGDLVLAPANGTVISAGYKGGYGNMVEIDHGNGLTSRYGHLSKIRAEVGESITRGEAIGQIGSTGRSTGPHLHFEVRLKDRPINPRFFLPPEPTNLDSIAR